MKRIDFIVIHCSADPADTTKDASDIRRQHLEDGWRDVGYHYLINRDGTKVAGRPEDMRGAHHKPVNSRSIGVCMIGGSPPIGSKEYRLGLGEDNFTPEQWITLGNTIARLHEKYPDAEIVGHRDLGAKKACPSFDVKPWWEAVQEYIRTHGGPPTLEPLRP